MHVPPGLTAQPGQVCLLKRSLYGLKQASRQWYAKLSSFLLLHGYHHSQADHSLFLKFSGPNITALLIYVDDIVLSGNDLSEITHVTFLLDQAFKVKNLGDLKYFLGLEVACSADDYTTKLTSETGTALADPSPYRRLIGKLIYLTSTRPNIAFAVQNLSQFVSSPTDIHFRAAFHVLRYLKQSLGAVYLGDSLISWKSKKQAIVSRSSSEAEYRALASTTCEIQWLTFLLEDFRVPYEKPALLFCDNDSAIQIASNQVFHERTKHIEIDCHVVREKVNRGVLKLLPIHSSMQLADILTKALHPHVFRESYGKLGMCNIHSQLEGGSQLDHQPKNVSAQESQPKAP
uniref:Retrovirus-related Pol polyprotein from transposon TNT 1-94 n=1 Tax=Cajanus cajan TaxID=3821 RepID=A0A151SCV8_CAJCA|nr:Retrovirus-related Pol polyprotein from transposon TNT 1-94 [Cajanus cajan]